MKYKYLCLGGCGLVAQQLLTSAWGHAGKPQRQKVTTTADLRDIFFLRRYGGPSLLEIYTCRLKEGAHLFGTSPVAVARDDLNILSVQEGDLHVSLPWLP